MMKYHVNEHVCSALRCLETSLLKGVAKELDNLELPNVYFFQHSMFHVYTESEGDDCE